MDAHGVPVGFFITSGTTADCTIAAQLMEDFHRSPCRATGEPAVYILLVSIRFQQILPVRSSAKNPEYPIDKLPGIARIAAARPLFILHRWISLLSYVVKTHKTAL